MLVQVLDRAAYLLSSRKAPGVVEPVMALLGNAAGAGADAARAVVQTPGLVRTQHRDSIHACRALNRH